MKPVLQLAAVGIVGIVLWKVAAGLLLPLFFFVFKIALIAGLIAVAFWFFNKKDRGKEDTPPASS
ncbi:MAG TPA: hypothetical protein VN513_11840 [Gemmatimonadales bacterium]|nr:hypothetical protein [Gemmatimonadales bacterium]